MSHAVVVSRRLPLSFPSFQNQNLRNRQQLRENVFDVTCTKFKHGHLNTDLTEQSISKVPEVSASSTTTIHIKSI